MSRHVVTSRRNGLKIVIPNSPQAGNLIQRFNLRGDNELVFEQKVAPTKDIFVDGKAITDEATSSEAGAAQLDDVI